MADSADGIGEELDYEHENEGGEVGGEGRGEEVEGGGEERCVQGSEGNIEEVEGGAEKVVEGGEDEHEFTKPADKVGRKG